MARLHACHIRTGTRVAHAFKLWGHLQYSQIWEILLAGRWLDAGWTLSVCQLSVGMGGMHVRTSCPPKHYTQDRACNRRRRGEGFMWCKRSTQNTRLRGTTRSTNPLLCRPHEVRSRGGSGGWRRGGGATAPEGRAATSEGRCSPADGEADAEAAAAPTPTTRHRTGEGPDEERKR